MTYLGRAYYETGKYAEARNALEKALTISTDDHLARLYFRKAKGNSVGWIGCRRVNQITKGNLRMSGLERIAAGLNLLSGFKVCAAGDSESGCHGDQS
jgi:tetratricopeptide (TPR) repeat protein